jgi:hypothetical protein
MPGKSKSLVPIKQIDRMIHTIRGVRVMLDRDLAEIYGVPTFRFNEAIKRNRHRFPPDFMFQLTREEFDSLTSQNAMSKTGCGAGALSLRVYWARRTSGCKLFASLCVGNALTTILPLRYTYLL